MLIGQVFGGLKSEFLSVKQFSDGVPKSLAHSCMDFKRLRKVKEYPMCEPKISGREIEKLAVAAAFVEDSNRINYTKST
jgi:hypothetical protein